MATNALKYIKNVGKSVTYASIESLKTLNPVFTSLAEDNKDTATSMYKAVRDIKKNTKRMPDLIKESEYGRYGNKLLTNLKADLKSGNFYNKERKDNAGFGDFDFGFDEEDGFGSFEDSESFDDNFESDNMMDIVGEKASSAVSNTMARSAEYIAENSNENRRAITDQMSAIYTGLHGGMSTINQNISKLLEFSTKHTATHFENSRIFYTEITRLDNERNALLKEISQSLKSMNEVPKRDPKYRKNTYSDITSYEGALNLESYKNAVKSNIKNSVGAYSDILKMIVEQDMFTDNPLGDILQIAITGMIPGAVKQSMETLNKSVGGLAANALLGIKNKSRTKGGIWDTISEIFGVNTSLETKVDTSKYEKGRVPFDGITRKAIVEVIPTYLAKILAALDGKPESRFNYETGQFTSIDKLQEQYNQMSRSAANRSAWDIDSVVRNRKGKLSFRDDSEKAQFEKDWEEIKQYMFKNQKTFNTRDKSLTGKSFGLKGGAASDVNVKLLQEILDGRPEMLQYANNLLRETDSYNRKMAQITDASALSALFNGSVPTAASGKPQVSSIVNKANNDVISELSAIHKELSYIRIYGAGSGGGKKKKGKGGPKGPKPSFDNFTVPVMRTGNENAYNMKQDEATNRASSNVESIDVGERASEIIGDAKFDALEPINKANKSFSEKMHEAAGLSAKMAVLVESATELSKKPAKFIVAMMDKADARLYDLIYGTKEDKKGKKSFAGRMFKGLENMFDKFSDFLTEHVLEPLKKTFSKENLHNMVKGFFNAFGVDIDQTAANLKKKLFGTKGEDGRRTGGFFSNFMNGFKDDMRAAGGWVKGTFKGAKSWMTKEARENVDSDIDRLKDLASQAMSAPSYASGIKRVDKTGLAVISEGEMVIPPDMNPLNIAKRKRNENKVKQTLKSRIESIAQYADGDEDFKKLFKEGSDDEIIEAIRNNPALVDDLFAKFETDKNSVGIKDLIIGEYAKLIKNIRNASDNFGLSDEQTEDFKEKAMKLVGNVKDYGHTMAAGATIGAGVSVFTGLIGGPLVGAAIGAGAGLLSKSETLQNMLFGEVESIDAKGNKKRAGGLIPKHITENIQKYFPDMSKGATIGGILAAMPFVPGGPLAGIMVGSAIGFAKNNDKAQKFLFGDDGLLGMSQEDFGKKVRSVLPKMGAGALAGLVAGPFGIGTNILLGSALGFAADTDKFKELVFGVKDKAGNLTGGLFGQFKDFLDSDILEPLRRAKDPFIEQFKIMGETITDTLKNVFKESIGDPVKDWFKEKLFKPLNDRLKGVLGGIGGILKNVVSAPFQAIGIAGDSLRARQIKSGRAVNYMQSAEERNNFRRSRGKLMAGGDRYRSIDASLENIQNPEDLRRIRDGLQAITDSRSSIDEVTKSSLTNIQKGLRDSKIDKSIRDGALKLVKAGQYSKAQDYIRTSNIEESKKNQILELVTKEASRMQLAREMKTDSKGTSQKLVEQMRSRGFDVSDGMLKKLALGGKDAENVLKLVESEYNLKKPIESELSTSEAVQQSEAKDQERHEETKDLFQEAINELKAIKENLKPENIDNNVSNVVYDESKADRLIEGVSDIYDENGAVSGTVKVGKKAITSGLKLTGRTGARVVKGGGKIVGGLAHIGSSAVKFAGRKVNKAYKDVRYSDTGKEWLGDKNKNWGPGFEPIIASEDEVVIDGNNGKDVKTAAEGKVGKDNAWSLFGIWQDMRAGVKKIAGTLSAIAFKDGIDTSTIDDKGDTDSFLKKIKSKFQKGLNTVTQFVNGLPIKMIRDKNGDLIPDPSDSDNDNNFKAINEKEETQKGILDSLRTMPLSLGGLFEKLFGKKGEDEEEESIFSKILKFFTGDGSDGKLSLFGIFSKALPLLGSAIVTALPIVGLTGALDKLMERFGFGDGEHNDKLYDSNGNIIQTDENGNAVKDENGNYISPTGEVISGSTYLQKQASLETMGFKDRLKYNFFRGEVTGKGSLLSYGILRTKTGKKAVKAVAESKPVQIATKLATGMDAAALDDVINIVVEATEKWKGVIKGIPGINKYADKIDDLGIAILEVVEKYLPKAGKALSSVSKTLGKLALPIAIATAATDFTTGWQDASTILKIKPEHVSRPQKFICGLVRTIKNFIPIIGTLIPDSVVVDLFINHVAAWFGIDVSKIKQQQSEAQAELDAWNAANPDKQYSSWAEYNKVENDQYTWTEKVGNAVSSFKANVKDKGLVGAVTSGVANSKVGKAVSGFASGVKDKAATAANWVKDKATGAYSWAKDTASSGLSWMKNTATTAVGAVKDFIDPAAQAVGKTINMGKDLGSYAFTVAKDALAEALTGKETDRAELVIADDDPLASYKNILYNLTKIVMLPYTSILKMGRTVWEKGIKPFGEGVIQVGTGVGTTAKNIITKSWSGDFFGAMKDTSGNVNGDNDLVNNISSVANGITKVVMALPGALAHGVGSLVRGIKSTIDGAIQIGSGISSTTQTMLTKSWQGDFLGAFTDTSGNLSTDNGLLNGISTVANGVTKVAMFVPATLSAGLGFVARNFHKVVDGFKTIGSSISDTVTTITGSAFRGELTIAQLFDGSTNAQTGNGLVDGASAVVNSVIKLGLAVPTLLTSGIVSIKNKVTDFFKEIAKAGEISVEDKLLMERAKEGEVSPFSGEYWKITSNLTGVAGGFNWFVSMMNKVFSLPTALISYLNPLELVKKGISWGAKKLGIDDSETRAETNDTYTGAGSRFVGRGTDGSFISQNDPKYKNQVFNTADDTRVQTLGNTGCAPAAAAMAINASMGSNVESMDNASKLALKYKVKDDGVSADYFGDQFARHGMSAKYIESAGSSGSSQIMKELMNNNKVVLMGQDATNTSKSTSPFGANPHYVVATGLSPDGKYIFINDPESTTPNMKYDANKILKSSSLGIAAKVANGTKKVVGRLRKFVGRGTYGPDTIQYKVWNALRNAGYNEIATAAAMGNIQAESAFNPSAIEKGNGVGFGLIQWSYSRRTALENAAAQRGVDPGSLSFQIEYLLKELEPNSGQWTNASSKYGLGSFSRKDWADGKDISAATKAFMCCFERPSYDPNINHIARRLEFAAQYYKDFTGTAIDTNLDLSYNSGLTTSMMDVGTSQPAKPMNAISEILGVFSGLAKAFGFTSGDSSGVTGSSDGASFIGGNPTKTVMSASGNVSANPEHAQLQKALVEKMYSVQGKLKYAQDNAKYPGSRNPEDGSGDCSSTVQWAYKNILGIDPGSWTGAQRENANTFTVATSTRDESKLQLGDLLLKDGHVEMYAGHGKMIGHGSGYGPKIKDLDTSGKYDLVRRWVGFQASGSGLKTPAYGNALKYVTDDKAVLPFSFDTEELERNKSSVMTFNSNKATASGTMRYVGRATEIPSPHTNTNKSDDLRTLVASIVRLLTQVVTNTDTLNNIAKLLGEYLAATEKVGKGTEVDTSPSALHGRKALDSNQKNTAALAKQNLINALQSANAGSSSTQLLKLIEATEKIARE